MTWTIHSISNRELKKLSHEQRVQVSRWKTQASGKCRNRPTAKLRRTRLLSRLHCTRFRSRTREVPVCRHSRIEPCTEHHCELKNVRAESVWASYHRNTFPLLRPHRRSGAWWDRPKSTGRLQSIVYVWTQNWAKKQGDNEQAKLNLKHGCINSSALNLMLTEVSYWSSLWNDHTRIQKKSLITADFKIDHMVLQLLEFSLIPWCHHVLTCCKS